MGLPTMKLHECPAVGQPRPVRAEISRDAAMAAVHVLLAYVGEDPMRPGLEDTPRRVADAWREMCGGLKEDPKTHLGRVFIEKDAGGLVTVRGIRVVSLCEHHMLPCVAVVDVGYIPSCIVAAGAPQCYRVVGLSKIPRMVEGFARRPQLQERMTNQIADAMMGDPLKAAGAVVRVVEQHACMACRGVKQTQVDVVTEAERGVLSMEVWRARWRAALEAPQCKF